MSFGTRYRRRGLAGRPRCRIRSGTGRRGLAAVMAILVAAVAGPAGCAERADDSDTVRIAIREPNQLTPGGVDEADGAQVLSALFTPLTQLGPKGELEPVAAESVEPSEGGRVWTIRLRDGYTFHNGEPVTAGSYLRAWNYAAHRRNQQRNSYFFRRIAGYERVGAAARDRSPAARTRATLSGLTKVDDLTFTVTLTEPAGQFAHALGAPAFYPLPDAAFDAKGRLAESYEDAPIGNGPFRIVGGWRRGGGIEVARYEPFPGDRPALAGIEFVIYPEAADPYPDLLAGRLDVVPEISAGHLATVEPDLGDRLVQLPGSTFHFLAFPAYEEELAGAEVRRAISMAIDRDELATGIFRDTELPARSFVPPLIPGARPDSCGEACRFDPAAARARYASAGGPARLTLTYNVDGGHRDWVAATCDQLASNLGVACAPFAEPGLAEVLDRLDQRRPVGMVRLSWAMDYPSMESYLGPIFSSRGSANVHGYRNSEVDALVTAGNAADSAGDALAAYQQAEDLVARDLPVVPLRFEEHAIGHSPRISGVALTRFDHLDITNLALVPAD